MAARLSPAAEQINSRVGSMNPERPVDTLSSVASLLRVKPQLQQLCRFGAQWASEHVAETDRWAPFHLVTRGGCALQLSGQDRMITLAAGDIVVLPHGTPHGVPGPPTPPDARGPFGIRSQPFGPVELKSNTQGRPQTQLICGRLHFDLAHPNLLLAALPEAIVVSAADEQAEASRLRMFMSAIQEEIEANRGGAYRDRPRERTVRHGRAHPPHASGRERGFVGSACASAARRGGAGHVGGACPELGPERTRRPGECVAREVRENVSTGGASRAARVPDRTQT